MSIIGDRLIEAAFGKATTGEVPKQDKRTDNTLAPSKPDEGNCRGACRYISYVKDKFIFGATGLSDTLNVE